MLKIIISIIYCFLLKKVNLNFFNEPHGHDGFEIFLKK